jgi:hypothetical protein
MKTRSQSRNEFSPTFFTESSASWMSNKIRRGAMLYYKCQAIQKNGECCSRIASQKDEFLDLDKQYCTQHAQLVLLKARM